MKTETAIISCCVAAAIGFYVAASTNKTPSPYEWEEREGFLYNPQTGLDIKTFISLNEKECAIQWQFVKIQSVVDCVRDAHGFSGKTGYKDYHYRFEANRNKKGGIFWARADGDRYYFTPYSITEHAKYLYRKMEGMFK